MCQSSSPRGRRGLHAPEIRTEQAETAVGPDTRPACPPVAEVHAPTPDGARAARSDPALPCPEALLAGTLALMTSWADPCPQARLEPARLRPLLARKLVSNLALMSQHPAFSAPLRQVLGQAQRRWAELAGGTAPERAEDAVRAAGRLMQPPEGALVH